MMQPAPTQAQDLVLSYFPGCSLHSSAREYDASTRAVCEAVGIELHELEDWNCCGSTSAHSLDRELAKLLPMRNLEIAERAGLDVLVPCAACYGRSKAAEADFAEANGNADDADEPTKVAISHILDVFTRPDVMDVLRTKITTPLTGLRTVCYYGCLTGRPPKVTGALDHEAPESMDRLVELAGATAVPWSCRTDCCGASLTLTRADVVLRLVDDLVGMAEEADADCIVVACSMCHANLDLRQAQAAKQFGRQYDMPILYVSELLGLAMGHADTDAWFRHHLTDPRSLLHAKGLT